MSEGILINKISGGGFISYALARVIAPTGTDVTLTSSRNVSKTITANKSKVLSTNANYSVYYFNVGTSEFGSCTLTGIDGDYTMTKLVNISTNVEYTFELSHRCPSGYQEVEYIEMPAKSYIVTDINIFGASMYDVEFEFYECDLHGNNRYIVATVNGNTLYTNSQSGQIWFDGWSNNNGTTGIVLVNTWINWKMQRNAQNTADVAIINGNIIDSNNYGNFNWGGGFFIFNSHKNQADGAYAYNRRRFRKCIITQRSTGEEIMNMIPCYRISDNQAGFFNTANEQFYANNGSIAIIAGPIV